MGVRRLQGPESRRYGPRPKLPRRVPVLARNQLGLYGIQVAVLGGATAGVRQGPAELFVGEIVIV